MAAATQLRALRKAAGLTGVEAGRRAGISQAKLSKLERGLQLPNPDDVRTLCNVYGATDDTQSELARLAETVQATVIEPARVVLSRGSPEYQARIRRLEASASLLRSYQPVMVIGLLQTADYARLVFTGGGVTGPEVDQAVVARLERQAQLRGGVTRASLIQTEGALRWQAGNPQVMAAQVTAIMEATELTNVDIGIIPWTRPVAVFPMHGFHLYDDEVVIIGTESGPATITDARDVADYEALFGRLHDLADYGPDARTVLGRIRDDYRSLS